MILNSIHYAQLIQYASIHLHMTRLNKYQINGILFYIYGVYYAKTKKFLFTDDIPEAWIYGPIFPKVYQEMNFNEVIESFTEEIIDAFNKDKNALYLIRKTVDTLHNVSARLLMRWFTKKDSPWYNTIYIKEGNRVIEQRKWKTVIPDFLIMNFFLKKENNIIIN